MVHCRAPYKILRPLFFLIVNCQLTKWSEWTTCSKTCGYGSISRYRQVAIPVSNGGSRCEEEAEASSCGGGWEC